MNRQSPTTPRDAPASLWRHRDFLWLWTGQTVSLVGSCVILLALPLTAALTLRAAALRMGVVRAPQYLPALVLGLFADVSSDRVRRRPRVIQSCCFAPVPAGGLRGRGPVGASGGRPPRF